MGTGVPFYTARDPGTPHGDEAGLDHRIGVKHLLVGGLVENGVDPPTQLGKAGDPEILILEKEGLVGAVDFRGRKGVLHVVGVNDRVLEGEKTGIEIVGTPGISWQGEGSLPDPDLAEADWDKGKEGD